MKELPELLKSFESDARRFLETGRVKEVIFSRRTYQVQVFDKLSEEPKWAFLQFDEDEDLKDCFCSCKASEDVAACVHLTAAYLKIYNDTNKPLHLRFEKSLWNIFCQGFAYELGYSSECLKKKSDGVFEGFDSLNNMIFSIHPTSKQRQREIKEIFQDKTQQTEETSLKFSNLSDEELKKWREGCPTPQVLYELSFWADLAKWMMLLQDTFQDYKITFSYDSQKIPICLHVSFPGLKMTFYLSQMELILLIPCLKKMNSPLHVYDHGEEQINQITYDNKQGCLRIRCKEVQEPISGITIGKWCLVPGEGFYSTEKHPLFVNSDLFGDKVGEFLEAHTELVVKYLKGVKVHQNPLRVHFSLSFDDHWNLHIQPFLDTLGDLSEEKVTYYGKWVYSDEKGFFRLNLDPFDHDNRVIPKENVGGFVSEHQRWLKKFPDFTTHLASIETKLSYALSDQDVLSFESGVLFDDEKQNYHDFSSWVYLNGQGFFPKGRQFLGVSIQTDIDLDRDEIPVFLKMNREELEGIPGFFAKKCPIIKAGIQVSVNEDGSISLKPEYELQEGVSLDSIRFFEDFIYIQNKGFKELPLQARLPEQFQRSQTIQLKNLDFFFSKMFEILKPYIMTLDPRLKHPKQLTLVTMSLERGGKGVRGEYNAEMYYESAIGKTSILPLKDSIKKKQRYVITNAGLIDLSEDRFKWLHAVESREGESLSTLELFRLHASDPDGLVNSAEYADQSTQEIIRELVEFECPEKPDIKGLKSKLRPYQITGLNWLWFLYRYNISGILCDDMGLGKTHQTMALIAAISNYLKKHDKPNPCKILVVCPTSVIYHWQEKLEEFLPKFQAMTYYGSQRSLKKFTKRKKILITSYGILRKDNARFQKLHFELAVFDEIQLAKNPNSKVHHALMAVNASMRIGLTGTPIENYLSELKALFDLTLPGFMPGPAEFKKTFIIPIERENNQERKQQLSKFIHPFILRRKKEDVLKDLPEKIEEISHCDLLPKQEILYRETLDRSRNSVLKELKNKGSSVPYIHVFALLSHLKQICNHPAAFLKDVANYKDYESGKWELFKELLNEAHESSQKVVVFSQYLGMLDIMEYYLREQEIPYASIRGATINRGDQLKRFNKDPECMVFLGSLQAVGLGVDLTAGSVVIHYDRWWNAARENQATDRVHRIGQKRGVQVFKLVTKNTFEERIDEIIKRKGHLMEEIIGKDDQHLVKSFSREDLIQLLKF